MTLRSTLVSIVLTLFCAATASAQAVEPGVPDIKDTSPTAVEDVTVVGPATRRAMARYAHAIGSGPPGRLSPRWNRSICVNVVRMGGEHAAFLKDRVYEVAQAMGLAPDTSPTCAPNVTIYASDDPDALATALVEAAPKLFQPARINVTLGDGALNAFRTTDAPVRWWQVSMPLMVDTGQPAIDLNASDTMDPMSLAATVRNGSRLRGNVRDDLLGVTIILDTGKVNSVPFEAVSDYVAFVALAPVDPSVETAPFDTVLNLFDKSGVAGLTLMDQDYLYALYTASRAPASKALQASEIASRMMTERERRAAVAN